MHKGPNSWHWIRPRRWRDTGEALKSAQSWRLLPSFLNSASLYKLWERASASELTGKQKTIKQRNAFFSQPLCVLLYIIDLQITQHGTYLYEHTWAGSSPFFIWLHWKDKATNWGRVCQWRLARTNNKGHIHFYSTDSTTTKERNMKYHNWSNC